MILFASYIKTIYICKTNKTSGQKYKNLKELTTWKKRFTTS